MEGNPVAERIRRAAEQTIDQGSARLRYAMDSAGPEGSPGVLALQEGLADFPRRRVRLSAFLPREVDKIGDALDGHLPDPETLHLVGQHVFAGGEHSYLVGGAARRLKRGSENGPRTVMDPTWLLEVLPGVIQGRAATTEDGTVEGLEKYELVIDLREAARRSPLGRIERPARWGVNSRRIAAHVWLHPHGLIRRMSWRPIRRTWRNRLLRTEVMWGVTEFWDFGADLESAPTRHAGPSTGVT